jgi:hypothetical protein
MPATLAVIIVTTLHEVVAVDEAFEKIEKPGEHHKIP